MRRLVVEQYQLPSGPQEPLVATVKRRKLKWLGHVARHRVLWRVGDAVVVEKRLERLHQRVDIPPKPEHSQGPPAEKTGRGSLLNHPSCIPDDPIGQGTELSVHGRCHAEPLLIEFNPVAA